MVFTDEAHFWFNGFENKQKARIWGDEPPEEVQEVPFNPDKTTVWCFANNYDS